MIWSSALEIDMKNDTRSKIVTEMKRMDKMFALIKEHDEYQSQLNASQSLYERLALCFRECTRLSANMFITSWNGIEIISDSNRSFDLVLTTEDRKFLAELMIARWREFGGIKGAWGRSNG